MTQEQIARDCYAALAVMEKDGWTTGPDGWFNTTGKGWCLEGALAQAIGMPLTLVETEVKFPDGTTLTQSTYERGEFDNHPTVVAVKMYLLNQHGYIGPVFAWNDNHGHNGKVERLLREVAAAHTAQPDLVGATESMADLAAQIKDTIESITAGFVKAGESKPVTVLKVGNGMDTWTWTPPSEVLFDPKVLVSTA